MQKHRKRYFADKAGAAYKENLFTFKNLGWG
jgi:hypothetical protein